jgi:hypothetical protein
MTKSFDFVSCLHLSDRCLYFCLNWSSIQYVSIDVSTYLHWIISQNEVNNVFLLLDSIVQWVFHYRARFYTLPVHMYVCIHQHKTYKFSSNRHQRKHMFILWRSYFNNMRCLSITIFIRLIAYARDFYLSACKRCWPFSNNTRSFVNESIVLATRWSTSRSFRSHVINR